MREPGRVRSLDGLRGLAAVIVAFGHATIATIPVLALVALGRPVHLSSFQEAISYSPLHALWAGRDWVIVFFVLSGFVLSIGAIEKFDARSYYPRRIIRLYVPVWAAVIFAIVAHVLVSHDAVVGATPWLNLHSAPLSLSRVAHELTLVFGAGDASVTTVLWSLRWEVFFSLALPLYLLIARRLNPLLLAGISLLVVFLGHDDYARYMPVFMLGVILAYERPWVEEHLTDTRALLLLLVSFCLLSGDWWIQPERLGSTLVVVGATGMVACGMHPGHFARLLRSKPFQLVGSSRLASTWSMSRSSWRWPSQWEESPACLCCCLRPYP
jgi:peptidoglycan/LPS O-acetylase OafA/YrhL